MKAVAFIVVVLSCFGLPAALSREQSVLQPARSVLNIAVIGTTLLTGRLLNLLIIVKALEPVARRLRIIWPSLLRKQMSQLTLQFSRGTLISAAAQQRSTRMAIQNSP